MDRIYVSLCYYKMRSFSSILCILVFCFCLQPTTIAQERYGVLTDNYLPVNQSQINPSAMVDQKPWISINLAGAHAYLRNNFLFIPNSRLSLSKREYNVGYEEPNKFGKAFVATEILGPSATINIKEHAFGVHLNFRTYANVNRIPAVLAQIIRDEGTDNIADGIYTMSNGRAKTMSWAELGLSYGRIIRKRDWEMIQVGGTLKRLIGVHQASITVRDAIVDVVNGEGTMRNMDGRYSFSEPAWNAGNGWGLSVGGTYKKMLKNVNDYVPHSKSGGCKKSDYQYKIGASLLDLGYIRFRQESRTATLPDTATVDDIEDVDEDILGAESNRFTAVLPTAISVQADYRYQENIYINAMIVQRISLRNAFGVERSNLVAIAPRYESSWFTASLPLSLANYEVPQLGLYFRFGPLAIGSDHITPFIIKHDIRAASLYFYLNIPIQRSPECRDRSARDAGKWTCPVW